MSTSPLIRVQTSAFINGSALRIKYKSSQTLNQNDQISPLKSTEQSPSKIINIYADSAIYNIGTTSSNNKNQQISLKDQILKTCVYSQMDPEQVEQVNWQTQKRTKDQIERTKNDTKQKEFYEAKKSPIKSALKKQFIDSSLTQSQQIDISKSSQNFRRKSIDEQSESTNQPIIKKKQVNQLNQSFHFQFQNKKQQLLSDIAKLDKQIVLEQERIPVQIGSPRNQKQQKNVVNKASYDKRQSVKQIEESQKNITQKKSKQIIISSSRNLNTSQNSKISPQGSPKQVRQKRSKRSQSQEIQESVDPLKISREDLNQRLQRMNEKYNQILEQSNKFRTHFQQI
ncbi:unnamed protein product [Paramecium sonneborni]|uniref:Uncharacterized protein n=1 Tax=Paramecium sonneborni TaxID=65129 RepID=A0A8S1P291_9CILI|nr:unnamed protein product [Paramecium sonneborni]